MQKVKGKRAKDRTDLWITKGGFICRAKGLNSGLRGLRIGSLRPDFIALDDVDGINDSIAVSMKKMKQISGSVVGTQARRWATILFGQNLITETGVMNMIHTGKTDVLTERVTIGVSNTFDIFEEGVHYRTYIDPIDGRVRHRILPSAKPTWAGVNIAQAQKFLNDSGLETFLAEYMNSFEHMKQGLVFHEFDEKRHVITWALFAAKFGVRHIPGHWKCKGAADFGYSDKSLSHWFFAATAAMNAPLAGRHFAYRARTFRRDSIDDQAINLWEDFFPQAEPQNGDHKSTHGRKHFEAAQSFARYPELFRLLNNKPRCAPVLKRFVLQENKYIEPPIDILTAEDDDKALFYVRQAQANWKSQITGITVSHEKTGEQMTLAQKYGLPVSKTKKFGADDGVTEANHLLRGDYTVPHPFFEDEKDHKTGLYRLGSPFLFIVVDDDQIVAPKNDKGFKTFRTQVGAQRWTEEKLTEQGLTKTIPMKVESDAPDSFRMFCTSFATPESTPLTLQEEYQREIPEEHRYVPVDQRPDDHKIITPEDQMAMQDAAERAALSIAIKKGWIRDPKAPDDYDDEFDFDGD
jgi:hypothetical protein